MDLFSTAFPAGARAPAEAAVATAVLDTNVLLDWLVFHDPVGLRVGEAVVAGRLAWVASSAMHDEMAHVLGRGLDSARPAGQADDGGWQLAWQRHVQWLPQPATGPAPLRCRDADDQKFVDFALAHRVRWLISRDKALLALRRPLAVHGVAVVTPPQWVAQASPAG